MDWLRRTIFETPTTVNSSPQQSDEAQGEAQTSDTTASGPGTSPRGSPSDGDSEVSSNRSRRTTPQHSERMVRKRRSLPRLRTSREPSPTSVSEPGKAGLTSKVRKDDGSNSESLQASLTSKSQEFDTIPETGEDESTSETRQVDSTAKSRKVDSTSEAPKTSLASETRKDDSTSESRQGDLITLSTGANTADPAVAPQMVPKPTNPDPLPSATQEAVNDGVFPKVPDVLGEQVSDARTFTGHINTMLTTLRSPSAEISLQDCTQPGMDESHRPTSPST